MSVSNDEIARQFLYLVYVTRKWFKSKMSGDMCDNHLFSEARFSILNIIKENERLKMSELSRYCRVSKGSLTITLGKLVEEGLVERVHHPEDRRVVMVRLTDSGEEYLQLMFEKVVAAISDKFESFKPEEKEKVNYLMRELTEIFK